MIWLEVLAVFVLTLWFRCSLSLRSQFSTGRTMTQEPSRVTRGYYPGRERE